MLSSKGARPTLALLFFSKKIKWVFAIEKNIGHIAERS